MALKKKGADRPALDQLEPEDVASFGEDPELLDPAEQAMLDGGNAGDAQAIVPRGDREATGRVADQGASPPSEQEGERQDRTKEDEGEELSDEQVRKLGPNETVPAWSLLKERQENRALKRNLEDLGRKLSEREELWNRAS